MKNLKRFTYIIPALLLAACGSGSNGKKPVSDIAQMREDAKTEMQRGPDAPRTVPQYIDRWHTEKQEEATLTNSYFSVSVEKNDLPLNFYENKASAPKFYLRTFDPDITMKLTAQNLPAGASLNLKSTSGNAQTYELNWTPKYGTLAFADQSPKIINIKLVPVLVSAKVASKADVVKGLALEKEEFLNVFRSQEQIPDLQVAGLGAEIQEGQTTPFTVTVTIPGVDDSFPQKPQIGYFNDSVTQVAGTNYREMSGVRYITLDDSRAAVEYLGNYKWKFNLVFDTKNMPVEAQKAKDGNVMANADSTHTRFVLKVSSAFNASPAKVVQVNIKHLAPVVAPAAPAPAPETPATPKGGKK
jgi:hypothetical protein